MKSQPEIREELVNKIGKDPEIWKIINEVRSGKITTGTAVSGMENLYGVKIPKLLGLNKPFNLSEDQKAMDESGLNPKEYLRRTAIIIATEELLFVEGVHERTPYSGLLKRLYY